MVAANGSVNYPGFFPEEEFYAELLKEEKNPDLQALAAGQVAGAIDPQLEARIDELNCFLSKSMGELLLNGVNTQAFSQFKEEIEKKLTGFASGLQSNETLLFFQDLAKQLTQEKPFFECSFSQQPTNLPLPVSISWLADSPLRIQTQNPALRVLLHNHLVPSTHTDYYKVLIGHILKIALLETPQELYTKHTIIFRQLHLEYHLEVSLLQSILLFFPDIFTEIIAQQPTYNLAQVSQELFNEYKFAISEVRFAGKIESKVLLVESLLASNSIPKFFIQTAALKEKFCAYFSFLLRHGITKSGPTLSDKITISLFTAVSSFLEGTHEAENNKLLMLDLYRAYTTLKARNEAVANEVDKLPFVKTLTLPAKYDQYQEKLSRFHNTPKDGSFLLRDLFGPTAPNAPPKTVPNGKPAQPNPIVQKLPQLAPLVPQIPNFNRKAGTLPHFQLNIIKDILDGKWCKTFFISQNLKLAYVGQAFTQAMLSVPHGTHLMIVPQNDLLTTYSWLVNFYFSEVICTAWKVAFRRIGGERLFPQFRKYFTTYFAKSKQAYGFDQILLDIASYFSQEQMLSLLPEITFDATHLKKVSKAHMMQILKQMQNYQMRNMLYANFYSYISKAYESISKLDHDDVSFNFCQKLYGMLEMFKNKGAMEGIGKAIDEIYEEFEEKTKESLVTRQSYFLLSSTLCLMNPTRVTIEPDQYYPVQKQLEQFMYLTPDDISLYKKGTNIDKSKQRHQIVISTYEECANDFFLGPKSLSLATLCLDDESIPQMENKFIPPTKWFSVALSNQLAKPAAVAPTIQKPVQKPIEKAPIKGFLNRQNTCFINAAIQALFCTRLSDELLNKTFAQDSFAHSLKLLKSLYKTDSDFTAHYETLIDQLFRDVPDIKNGRGKFHDVGPVLEEILDKLKYKFEWDETYSAIGEMQDLVQSRTKRHPLFVLPVPFTEGATLQSLIDQMLAPEEVHDAENRWNEAQTINGDNYPLADYITKHTLIEPLPDTLFVQLKRWKWDDGALDMVKDTSKIVYQDPIQFGSCSYNLKALIHQDHELMHYVAEVLIDGKWYRCDDKEIQPILAPDPANSYILILEKNQAAK